MGVFTNYKCYVKYMINKSEKIVEKTVSYYGDDRLKKKFKHSGKRTLISYGVLL